MTGSDYPNDRLVDQMSLIMESFHATQFVVVKSEKNISDMKDKYSVRKPYYKNNFAF